MGVTNEGGSAEVTKDLPSNLLVGVKRWSSGFLKCGLDDVMWDVDLAGSDAVLRMV